MAEPDIPTNLDPSAPDKVPGEALRETETTPPLCWRQWLIPAGAGILGVSVGAVITFFAVRGMAPTEVANPSVPSAEANGAPEEDAATRAEAFRQRQQFVSETVNQLGRDTLIGESPVRGNPDASVVVIEFSDFQCPYCAQAASAVDSFVDAHESEVLFVYKHLPLTQIHPQAVPAALAAWAAQQQGQFWPFHDALFARQDSLGDDLYVEIATELGLDLDQFNRDRAREAAQAAIARDLALAAELRLNSTPTFLMNDLLIPGVVPAEFFAEALDRIQAFQQQQAPLTAPAE